MNIFNTFPSIPYIIHKYLRWRRPRRLLSSNLLSAPLSLSQLLMLAQSNNKKPQKESNTFTSFASKKEGSQEACMEGEEVRGLSFLLVELTED